MQEREREWQAGSAVRTGKEACSVVRVAGKGRHTRHTAEERQQKRKPRQVSKTEEKRARGQEGIRERGDRYKKGAGMKSQVTEWNNEPLGRENGKRMCAGRRIDTEGKAQKVLTGRKVVSQAG